MKREERENQDAIRIAELKKEEEERKAAIARQEEYNKIQ